jgi:hypothetical protein
MYDVYVVSFLKPIVKESRDPIPDVSPDATIV